MGTILEHRCSLSVFRFRRRTKLHRGLKTFIFICNTPQRSILRVADTVSADFPDISIPLTRANLLSLT